MIKAAVIGCGYWGTILVKRFLQNKNFLIKYICDRNLDKLDQAKKIVSHNCTFITNPLQALNDIEVDLIIIATQANSHHELCINALKANKHIFVEKPFTLSTKDAIEIFKLARSVNKKIWADHTFLFTPGYQKLKKCIQQGMIGNALRFHSTRTDFGLFQKDTNIIWHLMIHDIYILLDLFGIPEEIKSVSSSASVVSGISDSIVAGFQFQNGLHATIHCDMLFPIKKREIIVSGDRGILLWDETDQHKLKFYPYTAKFQRETHKILYQLNQPEIIETETVDALTNEINQLYYFLETKEPLAFPTEQSQLSILNLLESVEFMDDKKCKITA